ncbi:hypothetical protein MLD38_004749 [Melastoma candidum]|uniref:Uncharacterized protein n=1 Tax=Melastoma candidum TaxID=119954 RepID=A0ACB9S8K9_9MYRT|nr:hypothetical protein MLD38_004749 [Melastoma candidum]
MEKQSSTRVLLFSSLRDFMRRSIFCILMAGPIPNHIAFIMDGNRRFAKKRHMVVGDGHKAGFESLITILNYCYQLGVKYVTVYAFSIENFKRKPEEVQQLMDLMVDKIDELLEGSFLSKYGIRLYFIGNLGLLGERVRLAAEKAMKATAGNSRAVLLICVAYTSYDEIVHAVEESCREKLNCTEQITESFNSPTENGHCLDEYGGKKLTQKENGYMSHSLEEFRESHSCEIEEATSLVCNGGTERSGDARLILRTSDITEDREKCPVIKLVDIERHMYMAVAPDPDILIRSSGETRLSNFLLWQTTFSPLSSPAVLWPEIGLWQLAWAVLGYQRNYSYIQKKRKQA